MNAGTAFFFLRRQTTHSCLSDRDRLVNELNLYQNVKESFLAQHRLGDSPEADFPSCKCAVRSRLSADIVNVDTP